MSSAIDFARNARRQFNPSAALAISIPSLISVLAVTFILGHVAVTAGAQFYRRVSQGTKGERIFVATPLGVYIISVLFSTLLSSIGATTSLNWVQSRSIFASQVCSTQASILQLGSLSTAFFVLYISCHALNAAVLRRPISKWVVVLCVVALWSLVLFLDLAGPLFVPRDRRAAFYGPAGSWCWITLPYGASQRMLLAVPMMIVLGLSIAIFATIFVRASTGSPAGGQAGTKGAASKQLKDKGQMMVMKYLMWYPIVYTIFNLPLAVAALMGKASSTESGVVFAQVLFGFQGLGFAVLFVFTHRIFGGRPWRFGVGSYTLQGGSNGKDTESFAALDKMMSPSTPRQWKPSAKEWAAPLDRAVSTRSASRYSTISSGTGIILQTPVPPMPRIPALHNRTPSESTLAEQPSLEDLEKSPDSANSAETVVELPEPAPMTVPAAAFQRRVGLPGGPSPSMRSVDLPRQPLQSALSKRGFSVNPKPAPIRKEASVRFAAAPTVYNMSPIETPISPESQHAEPVLLPARPAPAATAGSPTRKPVPKYETSDIRAPGAELSQPTITVPPPAVSAPTPTPLPPQAPAPRKALPQPMLVIPGRPERHERDTVFVMETPIDLASARPFTEYDMPLPILKALKQDVPSASPIEVPSPVDILPLPLPLPRAQQPTSPGKASLDSNGSLRYDSDDESILLYYAAEPSPQIRSPSPVMGDANQGIPAVNIVAGSDSGSRMTTPVNPNPHDLHLQAAPGLLAPPPPSARKASKNSRPGYL